MANPRRTSYSQSHSHSHPVITSNSDNPNQFHYQSISLLTSLKHFLKKPHSIPFLLSIFLLLTWLCLRLQNGTATSGVDIRGVNVRNESKEWSKDGDAMANLVRFASDSLISPVTKDKRGWMLDPVAISHDYGIQGGAMSCTSMHVGEIRPGAMRGNHRHHTCNETFIIWGGKTYFRVENNQVLNKGFAEVIIGADEVAVAASPKGTAHALINMDSVHTTYFIGCQDSVISYNSSTTDFAVWKDL